MDLQTRRKFIKVGEQVSNKISDMLADEPEKELRFYLKKLYPFDKDFIYSNFNRTLEMFKNNNSKPKVLEIINGEEVYLNPIPKPTSKKIIKTSSTPNYEENEIFEFQCEPNHPIIHTIFIERNVIKEQLERLNKRQQAYLFGYIHPNATLPKELSKFEKDINKLKHNKPKQLSALRISALNDLYRLLCDI